VRGELVSPDQRAVARVAGQHAGGPLVVALPLFGIVGRRIAGAIVDEGERRIVGYPSPHRSAAFLPGFLGPAGGTEIGARDVAGLEDARFGQHLAVRPDVMGGPDQLASLEIERLEPAVDPELPARGA